MAEDKSKKVKFLTEMFRFAQEQSRMQPIGRGRLVRNKADNPTMTTSQAQEEALEYMVKHALVKSAIDRRCDAVIRRRWRLVGGDEADRDKLTEFFESQNMPMILDHLERQSCGYGKAPIEILKKEAKLDEDRNPEVDAEGYIITSDIPNWWEYQLMPRDASVIKEIYHSSGYLRFCEFVPFNSTAEQKGKMPERIMPENIVIYYNSKYAGYDISPSILDSLDSSIESFDRTNENKQIMEDKYAIGFWQVFLDPEYIKYMEGMEGETFIDDIMNVWNNTGQGSDIGMPPGVKFIPQTMPMQGLDAIVTSMKMAEEEIYRGFGWTLTDIRGEKDELSPLARTMVEAELLRLEGIISSSLIPNIMDRKTSVGLPKWRFLEDADTEVKTSKSDVMTASVVPQFKEEVAERKGITLSPEEINQPTIQQMQPTPSTQIEPQGKETFAAANPTVRNYTGSKIPSSKVVGE